MLRDIASAHAQEVSTTFVAAYNTEDVDETCEDMHDQLGRSTSAHPSLNEEQGRLRLHRNFKQLMDQVGRCCPHVSHTVAHARCAHEHSTRTHTHPRC
jgi:hypothetical protein